jgi:hypothetical protein
MPEDPLPAELPAEPQEETIEDIPAEPKMKASEPPPREARRKKAPARHRTPSQPENSQYQKPPELVTEW